MKIRYYNETTKQILNTHITDVFFTGKKPIFEIELFNGKKIRCTKEHMVLSQNGFISLEDGAGLSLQNNTAFITNKNFAIACNGVPLHQSYEWLKDAKTRSIANKSGVSGIAKEAGVSYHTIRKWLKKHSLRFTRKEMSLYVETWNKGRFGYKNKPLSMATIEKMRKSAKRGSESNLWRGGADRSERLKIADWCDTIRKEKLVEYNYSCKMCGTNEKLELDHIQPVSSNPELAYEKSNIQVLCKVCHKQKHKTSGDHKTWAEKRVGQRRSIVWSKIKHVKYIGEDDTYDLQVEHSSHNYVANGMVVHNSGRYSKFTSIEPIEYRLQGKTNRQVGDEVYDLPQNLKEKVEKALEASKTVYNELIEAGVAKECARMVLPLTTTTTMYMKGSVRSWIHYLGLRTKSDTQKEHRDIAVEIQKIFVQNFPNTSIAMGWEMESK